MTSDGTPTSAMLLKKQALPSVSFAVTFSTAHHQLTAQLIRHLYVPPLSTELLSGTLSGNAKNPGQNVDKTKRRRLRSAQLIARRFAQVKSDISTFCPVSRGVDVYRRSAQLRLNRRSVHLLFKGAFKYMIAP